MKQTSKKQNRKYPTSRRRSEYEDSISYGYDGKPSGDKDVSIGLSVKALRNQPKSSYSIQADPYTAALPGSEPYPILNKFNRVAGGKYGGVRNLDGGNVQQYANSVKSTLLGYADFAYTKASINYRFIPGQMPKGYSDPSKNYPGKALINEQRRAIAEATSILQSTTFTQMAIYDYCVATDMPMGDATAMEEEYTPTGGGGPYKVYDQLTDVIYAALRFYQMTLLDVCNFITWQNSFRLKMGTMIRSSWNRETPNLNALFGLFKKKSFLSLLDSICMAIPGEYVDVDFLTQMAIINAMPSRRSNAITDPVLEMSTMVNKPARFILLLRNPSDASKVLQTPVFDSGTDFVKSMQQSSGTATSKSFADAINELQDLLSAEKTMAWARNATYPGTDTARYNEVKWRIDVVQSCLTTFKTKFNDIREVLDTVARTGLVKWRRGFRPSVTKDTDAPLFRNLLLDDIYRMLLSGADSITLNDDTKRWRTFSLWNMYDGIPEYDAMSGGAFLTFSMKNIDASEDADGLINYVPVCLIPFENSTTNSNAVVFVTRDGIEMNVNNEVVIIHDDEVMTRLTPLVSQNDLKIRRPKFEGSTQEVTTLSNLMRTLTSVFGCSNVEILASSYPQLDPDVIAVYQIELEDITNEAIAYARANGPFKGAVNDTSGIGLLGFVK